jgi:hypothetical protein
MTATTVASERLVFVAHRCIAHPMLCPAYVNNDMIKGNKDNSAHPSTWACYFRYISQQFNLTQSLTSHPLQKFNTLQHSYVNSKVYYRPRQS